MRALELVAAIGVAVVAAGAQAAPPAEPKDQATLVFNPSGDAPEQRLIKRPAQRFSTSSTPCKHWSVVATYTIFNKSGPKPVAVAPEAPLYLLGVSMAARSDLPIPTSGPSTYKLETCTTAVSFAPERGHTYEVIQEHAACTLRVTDAQTGVRPPTLQRLEPKSCQPKAVE